MNSVKSAFTSNSIARFGKSSRLAAVALVAGVFHSGCLDSSPGGSQGESQSQPQGLRALAANPLCKIETHLLILDEDAIKNASHCGCALGHNGEKDGDKDWSKDEDDDKDDGKDDKDKHCDKDGKSDHDDKDDDDDQAGKVTICHIPPGNHDNGHTITVGASAVKAHLAHGDKVGACVESVPPCNSAGGGSGGGSGGAGYGRDNNRGKSGDREWEKGACEKSAIGKRTTVKFFADNVGREILIPAGTVGDEGWFAPTTIRIAWKNAGPEIGDGLRNYLAAGPGLGSPDAKGNKESLLDNVPDLTPLRALGLARLEGSSVCGVVLDGEVKMAYNPRTGNIQGPNLGKVAFQVLGTENGSLSSASQLPNVRVRILDAEAVCSDPLTPYLNAPAPISMCEPRDVERPSCSVLKTLVSEPWNVFDTTVWRGDGFQVVEGGLFHAQDGAFSAAADYISPCPIPVESTSAVRFTNRLQLNSQDPAAFAESGALFFVNSDIDGSFNNYVFINVGYTMAPSKVYVELFGSNNGLDFDQFEETSLAFSPSQIFNVDLLILPDAYQIAVGEEVIDTVRLTTPVSGVGFFEVGVQQSEGGLRGLIDMTTISKICQKEVDLRCRKHSLHRDKAKERLGKKCLNRNSYIRQAKERIKHCDHPSMGMRVLARMKEKPEKD